MHDEILPNSEGLLRCLQAIAEEAETLGLTNTSRSLQQAISVCRAETQIPHRVAPAAHAGTIH